MRYITSFKNFINEELYDPYPKDPTKEVGDISLWSKFRNLFRTRSFNELEKKIYLYQSGYRKIDDRFKGFEKTFKSFYFRKYGIEVENLKEEEIARFLTKHYLQDIHPYLTGLFKDKVLFHGTENVKDLTKLDWVKHLGKNMGNLGFFGKGFYLTSYIGAAGYYGLIQPMVVTGIENPYYISFDKKGSSARHPVVIRSYIRLSYDVLSKDRIKKYIKGRNWASGLAEDNFKWYDLRRSRNEVDYIGHGFYKFKDYVPALYTKNLEKRKNQIKEQLITEATEQLRKWEFEEQDIKTILSSAKFEEEANDYADFSGRSSDEVDVAYELEQYDLIVADIDTSGRGVDDEKIGNTDVIVDAEVVVRDKDQVSSIFPSADLIMNSSEKEIKRNLTDDVINEKIKR